MLTQIRELFNQLNLEISQEEQMKLSNIDEHDVLIDISLANNIIARVVKKSGLKEAVQLQAMENLPEIIDALDIPEFITVDYNKTLECYLKRTSDYILLNNKRLREYGETHDYRVYII